MKNFSWIFGIIIILGTVSCSHTPKGIDPTPLYNLQLPDDLDVFNIIFEDDSTLAKKYNCELIIPGFGRHENKLRISVPATNDTNEYIMRNIDIWQFETCTDALEWYSSEKSISLIESKLYKEEQENNKYFMIYKRISISQNHGIPLVDNSTILDLSFLLNRYLVIISYTDFVSKNKNYKQDINNDIILVSKIFNDVMSLTGYSLQETR